MLIQNIRRVNSSTAAVNLAVAANLLVNLCDVKVKQVLPKKNKVKQGKAKIQLQTTLCTKVRFQTHHLSEKCSLV